MAALDEILAGYEALRPAQEAFYQDLHRHPELSHEEHHTAQKVGEDFSKIPDAAGVPYTYWGLGYTDRDTYLAAEKAGHLADLTSNHSPKFLPPMQPCLRTGTEALLAAALAWLAP
jgi:metal-dependent amidase/aminoacylase/carboxypeptidase family protein